MGKNTERKLPTLLKGMWKSKQILKDWEIVLVISLYKKGNARSC
jgi:hypothetical protein